MRLATLTSAGAALVFALVVMASAEAQVTPEIKARIAAIGRVVDPPSTALIYAPMQPAPPYPNVKVTRDISYGPDPRNILDLFQPVSSTAPRPVLIYLAGGPGNKIEDVPAGRFYDNVMLWAVRNGMIGVNVERRTQFAPWDAPAEDVARMLGWVQKNIGGKGGDPKRVFVWAHSASAATLAHYLAHPALYPHHHIGLAGAILFSGPYNLAPLVGKAPPLTIRMGMSGKPFQMPPGPPSEVMLAKSDLPGMRALKLPLFLGVSELDPEMLVESTQMLNDQLCDAGRCPRLVVFKDHGHMSSVLSIGSADVSTSQPVLDWIRGIK